MQLELFPIPKEVADTTKVCSQCKKELPLTEKHFTKNVNNKGVPNRYKHICKGCVSENSKTIRYLRTIAPPRTECCELCNIPFSKLTPKDIHLDHCHKTSTFRGWLCKNCNVGIGMLGDDIQGLQEAIAYLRKANERT